MAAVNSEIDIVYLPGFLGTELISVATDDPLWNLELGLVNQLKGLEPESIPTSQVYPGKPLRFVYRPHVNSLRKAGYRVHWFGFDWRLGLPDILERLKRFIHARCEGRPHLLLGHSTGGVLSLLYLGSIGETGSCKGMVGFGVPVGGADYLADFLLHGDDRLKKLKPVLELDAIRRRLAAFQLIFDLMPAELVRRGADNPLAHLAGPRVCLERARESRQKLDEAIEALHAARVPVTLLLQEHQQMRRCRWTAGSVSFVKGPGDGWISAERGESRHFERIAVPMKPTDFAAAGLFGVFSRLVAAHPFQPMYPSMRSAIRAALDSHAQ